MSFENPDDFDRILYGEVATQEDLGVMEALAGDLLADAQWGYSTQYLCQRDYVTVVFMHSQFEEDGEPHKHVSVEIVDEDTGGVLFCLIFNDDNSPDAWIDDDGLDQALAYTDHMLESKVLSSEERAVLRHTGQVIAALQQPEYGLPLELGTGFVEHNGTVSVYELLTAMVAQNAEAVTQIKEYSKTIENGNKLDVSIFQKLKIGEDTPVDDPILAIKLTDKSTGLDYYYVRNDDGIRSLQVERNEDAIAESLLGDDDIEGFEEDDEDDDEAVNFTDCVPRRDNVQNIANACFEASLLDSALKLT